MKTMLKILTMLMALTLVLSLAACGEEKMDTPVEETPTVETAPEGETPEGETTAPATEEVTPATEAATATEATTEATTTEATTTDATTPSQDVGFDAEVALEEELWEDSLGEDDMGTPPAVTVKYEVYLEMSDSEKEAYRDCFSNPAAFDFWEENALMYYENETLEDGFIGAGSLNLKDIYEQLTGKYDA